MRPPERRVEKIEAAEAIAANRAYMAELTEGFQETKPRPSSQASSIRLRRSDMGGMATLSGGSTVSDNAFATIFDIPLFGQLDDSQRACFFRGQWQWNPAEALPHNFAVPFFTTKGGSGTGLGLVISHRIVVERHHGKIDFSTGPDGTQFNVRLPFESPPALSL